MEQRNGDVFAFDHHFNNMFSHAIPAVEDLERLTVIRAWGEDSGLRLSIIIWAIKGEALAVREVTRRGPGFPQPELVPPVAINTRTMIQNYSQNSR